MCMLFNLLFRACIYLLTYMVIYRQVNTTAALISWINPSPCYCNRRAAEHCVHVSTHLSLVSALVCSLALPKPLLSTVQYVYMYVHVHACECMVTANAVSVTSATWSRQWFVHSSCVCNRAVCQPCIPPICPQPAELVEHLPCQLEIAVLNPTQGSSAFFLETG